ncbi:MAG: hypothetical protein A3A83_02310 [Candidatus Doudnabacteria bacterium RIFCSPLOWO2_01_FULL_48_57]|nr:MAG: hypothetical protein A2668_00930 [Candidatus Doudnabacteria bacterium RIFCSPHIGHO2_01_FULL_48_180]OGE98068.1 MAG: hypothetical protein A3A83_02310 [Candidatus Doudnabacteria bacterium RIFCSPLOWO2_01_FULL_48_57]
MEQQNTPVQPSPVNQSQQPQQPHKHLHPAVWAGILVAIAAVVGYVVWTNSPKESEQPTVKNTTDKAGELKTYRNEELGFTFEYPSNLEISEGEDNAAKWGDAPPGLRSEGKWKEIRVFESDSKESVFTVSLASSDYAPASSEGCCYWYVGNPIDPNKSAKSHETTKTAFFWNGTADVRNITLDGQKGFKFLMLGGYLYFMPEENILLPFTKSGFANMLIRSPRLLEQEIDHNAPDNAAEHQRAKGAAIERLHNKEFLNDSKTAQRYNAFNQILSTFEFIDPNAHPANNYKNEKYGFEIKLSSKMNGFKAIEKEHSILFKVPSVGLQQKVDVDAFFIAVTPLSEWEGAQKLQTGILIARNDKYVYGYGYTQDPAGVPVNMKEIDSMISTMKFDAQNGKSRTFITDQTMTRLGLDLCFEEMNGDPENTIFKYSSGDLAKPITFDVPYNHKWGSENYAITAYEDDGGIVRFGPIGSFEGTCSARALFMSYLPAKNVSQVIEDAKKEVFYDIGAKQVNINGLTVVEYNSGEVCGNVNAVVIGKEANYQFHTLCGGEFSDLENIIKTVKLSIE